VIKTIITV
jgi:tubulin polyglutamylase TTLL6/13